MAEKKFNVTRNNGKVIGIEFNAEAFIVPNHSGKYEDFWLESSAKKAKNIATNVLGKEPDQNELYVQVWYVVQDLHCDNLVDHGASVYLDEKRYLINLNSGFLPYSALRGKDDGDKIDVFFDNWVYNGDDEQISFRVTMHVTLNQKDYRYARFGSFKEVCEHVTH